MPLDSESRWRLVRLLKTKGEQPEPSIDDIVIRKTAETDLAQICEIYNYYVVNSVVTFDRENTTE